MVTGNVVATIIKIKINSIITTIKIIKERYSEQWVLFLYPPSDEKSWSVKHPCTLVLVIVISNHVLSETGWYIANHAVHLSCSICVAKPFGASTSGITDTDVSVLPQLKIIIIIIMW